MKRFKRTCFIFIAAFLLLSAIHFLHPEQITTALAVSIVTLIFVFFCDCLRI